MKKHKQEQIIKSRTIRLNRSRYYRGDRAVFAVMQKMVDAMRIEPKDASSIKSKHPLLVYTLTDPKGVWWVAEYTNLPGVVGTARSMQDAINDLNVNMKFHIQASLEAGCPVPKEYL